MTLTHKRVLFLFSYDPAVKRLRWRNPTSPRLKPGALAGTIHPQRGYIKVKIGDKFYPLHRLMWFYKYGRWPKVHLDHIDGTPHDNTRVRECTISQNHANRKCRKDSISGIKGVSQAKSGRWVAKVTKDGLCNHLGTFDSPQDAQAAYMKGARRLFGEFARASSL